MSWLSYAVLRLRRVVTGSEDRGGHLQSYYTTSDTITGSVGCDRARQAKLYWIGSNGTWLMSGN